MVVRAPPVVEPDGARLRGRRPQRRPPSRSTSASAGETSDRPSGPRALRRRAARGPGSRCRSRRARRSGARRGTPSGRPTLLSRPRSQAQRLVFSLAAQKKQGHEQERPGEVERLLDRERPWPERRGAEEAREVRLVGGDEVPIRVIEQRRDDVAAPLVQRRLL